MLARIAAHPMNDDAIHQMLANTLGCLATFLTLTSDKC